MAKKKGSWWNDPERYAAWYAKRWGGEPPTKKPEASDPKFRGAKTGALLSAPEMALYREAVAENARRLINPFIDALQPPPQVDIDGWANEFRVLSPEASAMRGEWRSWPFQDEPMRCLSPSDPCDTVVICCSVQTMKTEILLNALGYVIDIDPGPTLVVEPRQGDAEGFSKDRLDPMLRDCPTLRGKIVDRKSRDSGNTMHHKRFRGGHVTMSWATSPSGLAMRPIRYLFMDEVDRYPLSAGREGDPIRLAIKRTVTYWNRKILMCSTPTTEFESRIWKAYLQSDQRQFVLPCPHCNYLQVLVWNGIQWDKTKPIKEGSVWYQCANCNKRIDHHQKRRMLERGKWKATNKDGNYPGFWINLLYSPSRTWDELAVEYMEVKDDPEQYKTFVNTVLAEPSRDRGEAPDWEKLRGRMEDYRLGGPVPAGVRFLTAGVDVQQRWLEVSIWGWGRNRESWLVDHIVIEGNYNDEMTWDKLTTAIRETYHHEQTGAPMSIRRVAVDTGFGSTWVYDWARQIGSELVMCVKGQDTILSGDILGAARPAERTFRGKAIPQGVLLHPVNVSGCKAEWYALLNMEVPDEDDESDGFPRGWVHYPQLEREMLEQFVSEDFKVVVKNGVRKGVWTKNRDRNEALDCRNYARAAAENLGWSRMKEPHFKALEAALGIEGEGSGNLPRRREAEYSDEPPKPVVSAPNRRRRRFEKAATW